ncbi:hypothetical protein UA08_08191 [Talaromyces atroroseus]|uniref:Zn(2)-C6 fungal-type domain-containing protein n=1 Tax=Talaromyces atroroseus TaxID=1441469 RepID=A0A225AH74_TALAT|nr:hypothetical protein UA08_08191 [Talaromyces atroroseus]OKL56378.1 hypothetical protein UA08_08191 [Talaromyces atroroseus]
MSKPPAKRRLELVFTDPLTKPKPKRQQVSKACEWCRTFRIKCDSRFPCTNCQAKGRACNVRNTNSTRTFSEALKRIETLQDRIKDLEKQVETARSQAHDVVSNQRETAKPEQSPASVNPNPPLNPDPDPPQEECGASGTRSRRKSLKHLESIQIRTAQSQQRHYYGRSSSFYFIGRLSSYLGIAPHQLTPDGLMRLDSETRALSNGKADTEPSHAQSNVLTTEQYLTRGQEEYFLGLFWHSYNLYYPIIDREQFKSYYQSLWTSQTIRKPSALVDIVLAISMQYADALMPRDYLSFRTNIEGIVNVNIDAVGTGRKFFRRCQLLLTDELEGPSNTTLQCHFFSVIYLSNSSYHNVAHSHLASAIRTGVILGLHWRPSETLPLGQAEFNGRLWWTVYALEMKVAMELGRPLAVDLSEVTCHPPENHEDDPHTFEGTNRYTANKHYVQLMLASRSVHAAFQKKYSEVLEECSRDKNYIGNNDQHHHQHQHHNNNINNLYSNPGALEKVAEAFASMVQSLHAWRQDVPEPLKTKRMNGGEPLSTDRSVLNLKQHVPLGMSRCRLFLELLYHNLCMNLYRPFICFYQHPDGNRNTPFVDANAASSLNHAVTITSIIHQALKQTNFLAGFHEAFQWQWNATITLVGFLAAFPASKANLIPSTRKALKLAIQVFDLIGKYLGIACSAARVTRDLFARADRLASLRSNITANANMTSENGVYLQTTANGFAPAFSYTSIYTTDQNVLSTWNADEQAEFASSWATYPGGDEDSYILSLSPRIFSKPPTSEHEKLFPTCNGDWVVPLGTDTSVRTCVIEFAVMVVSVGILSIGDMGMGIARLLRAHAYQVLTVGAGRSQDTLDRIQAASITALPTDQDLVIQSDYILSVVPPRDSLATARRILDAVQLPDTPSKRAERRDAPPKLYFFDLNAAAPRLMRDIESLARNISLPSSSSSSSSFPVVHFLDGGIIGGPPSYNAADDRWKKPSIVISGPVDDDFPSTFAPLAETLNMKIVGPKIGSASALKLSFASLTKGLTALTLLSFATAQSEAVLPELLEHLNEYAPTTAALTTGGAVSMAPKAYRWVEEMRAIGEAFDTEGHWDGLGSRVYGAFAEVYRKVAEDTVLGEEKIGRRQRGQSAEDVAEILAQANRGKPSTQ